MNQECHLLFQLYNAFCFPHIIRKTSATTETLQKKGGPQKLPNHLHPKEQPLHSPLPPFKSFYSSFILFFPSFLLKVIFTVWSMLESPQQSVLDKVGTSLRHEPTRLHILNKCTCARICTRENRCGYHNKHNRSLSLHDPI